MRHLFFTLLIVLSWGVSFSINWTLLCPDSIQATNICFETGLQYGVICSPDGMYIYEDDMEWHFYTYGYLPIVDATYYSPEKILVVMGDGSWSDGIYTFDLQSHEFEVAEWYPNPNFIRYYPGNGVYYAGFQGGGLHISSNGLEWENIPYFDTIPCYDMDFYDEHIVLSEGSFENNNIHLSDDSGASWFNSQNGGYFSEVEFDLGGILYAVFPGESYSSGVYKSEDYGNNWDILNWELLISSLECDVFGNALVGWENGYGLAMLDPNVMYPDFVYLNQGLPDTHVNNIKMNPYMSAIVIFACTNSGVYYSIDYFVGVEESGFNNKIEIFPNPVLAGKSICVNIPDQKTDITLKIISGNGSLEYTCMLDNHQSIIDLPVLSPGMYYCVFENRNFRKVEKLLVY